MKTLGHDERTSKNLFLIVILFLTILSVTVVCFIVQLDKKRYDKICSNPPSEFWIEEDLEMVFLTTQVNVLETDDLGDGLLIVKVRIYDEGAYRIYRCLYKVERRYVADFFWKFERYV